MAKTVGKPTEDLNQVVTLGILRRELKNYATKDDLKKYATRDEMAEMFEHQNDLINDLHNEMIGGFKKVVGLLENHDYRISQLELRFADKKKR